MLVAEAREQSPTGISADFQREIEQFLFREVRLLSEGRYREWLVLFTDDVKYWMPIRETRPNAEDSVATEEGVAIFDDDKKFLSARVQRMYSDMAHAERPPSRTRYFVTNVEVERLNESSVRVDCNVLIYQSRLEKTESMYVGRREDVLRKVEGGWRIARRKIVLDHAVLPRSISIFF